MKFKTTKKAIQDNYGVILSVGYCDAYYIFYGVDPVAYTCGVYGWNADIYEINGVAVVTGYRPFGNYHFYDIVKQYNDNGKKICDENAWGDYNKKMQLLERNRDDFYNAVLEAIRK